MLGNRVRKPVVSGKPMVLFKHCTPIEIENIEIQGWNRCKALCWDCVNASPLKCRFIAAEPAEIVKVAAEEGITLISHKSPYRSKRDCELLYKVICCPYFSERQGDGEQV